MTHRLLPALSAFLGAAVWALSRASTPLRIATWVVVAAVDVTGAVVVWTASKRQGHRAPARAARLFSLSWLAAIGFGATMTAVVAWLGELGGRAVDADPGTAGLIAGAAVTLGAALAGVVTEIAAAWTPAGVARTAIVRVYGPAFPRIAGDGTDPPEYLDAYRAVWDDPAILSSTEVVAGWGTDARRRRLEAIATALSSPRP